MRQEFPLKADTPFHKEPVTVTGKTGNHVTVECSDGRRVERNITHFKPYILPPVIYVVDDEERERISNSDQLEKDNDDNIPTNRASTVNIETSHTPKIRQSERERKTPQKFKDYDMKR